MNLTNTIQDYNSRQQKHKRKINFLDFTLVLNDNGSIKTNWFRNDINTNQYINSYSNTPNKYKVSIINGFNHTAIKLPFKEFHNENINIVTQNGFPKKLIDSKIKKRLYQIFKYRKGSKTQDTFELPSHQYTIYTKFISKIQNVLHKYGIEAAYKNLQQLKDTLYTNLK